MSLRWKLNLSVASLVLIFIAAGAFGIRTVIRHGELTRQYTRMRTQSQFTSDVRTHVYQHVAASGRLITLPPELAREPWPQFILDDIVLQVQLAVDEDERRWWSEVHAGLLELGRIESASGNDDERNAAVQRLERDLHYLRNHYDVAQCNLTVEGAKASLIEHAALWIACGMTVLLFLVYLIMVRDWLVKPMEVLKRAADTIGRGELGQRIPLRGRNEMAELARGIESMALGLAQRQAELVEARELSAIGELCANVAHGLRNPLAAIRATAQLAERRAEGKPQLTEMMRDLAAQSDRMDQRITRLFDFSRRVRLHVSDVCFTEVAGIACQRAHPLVNSRRLQLTMEDQTNGAVWRLDREQIAEALAELLTNAAHHSPPGASIVLHGQALPPHHGDNPRLRIEVIDHGAGMDPTTQEKAFDLFFTSRPNGTGMGLALVRRIVQKHGGHITMRSAPGQGTTLIVTLESAPATKQLARPSQFTTGPKFDSLNAIAPAPDPCASALSAGALTVEVPG